MRKLTTQGFIDRAQAVHGDWFDYSQVEYVTSLTKVKIVCPEHGVFEQSPKGHMRGNGCPQCSGRVQRTTPDFTGHARQVHGDRFDYSQAKYVNNKTKVKIICPVHGMFEQTPKSHLNGHGCQKCYAAKSGKLRRKTNKQFIAEVEKVHSNKFDYRLINYTHAHATVKIICPEHGEFEQKAMHHLNGHGCSACVGTKPLTQNDFVKRASEVHENRYSYEDAEYVNYTTKVNITCSEHGIFEQEPAHHLRGVGCPKCADRKVTEEEFIRRSKEIHQNNYEYYDIQYVDYLTKVRIKCPIHGYFEQSPNVHLDGSGCPECGIEKIRQSRLKSEEQFISDARAVHGDIYDYSESEYIDGKTKIKIMCSLHGVFEQRPADHLRGTACPACSEYGFDPHKPAILYYLRIETRNQLAYKIGITNRTVEERFQLADLEKITIIEVIHYDTGKDAHNRENEILHEFSHAQYTGEPILTSGNSELFNHDILKLDAGYE